MCINRSLCELERWCERHTKKGKDVRKIQGDKVQWLCERGREAYKTQSWCRKDTRCKDEEHLTRHKGDVRGIHKAYEKIVILWVQFNIKSLRQIQLIYQ